MTEWRWGSGWARWEVEGSGLSCSSSRRNSWRRPLRAKRKACFAAPRDLTTSYKHPVSLPPLQSSSEQTTHL